MSNLITAENFDSSLKIAAGYSRSANILMKYVGQTRNPDVVHSMIVLRSLALDIYLRCLYAIEHDKPYEGHHLKQIFDALAEETRRQVTEYYDRSVAQSDFIQQTNEKHYEIKGHVPRLDLEHVLQEWAEALGDGRYFFDPNHKVVFLAYGEMEKALLRRLEDLSESKVSSSSIEQKSAA